MNIDQNVLEVLSRATIEDQVLTLPAGQLDRKLYVAVNKVLEAAGGKWDRKAKGHVFSRDPSEVIEQALLTGEITDRKKEFDFFPTPKKVVARLIELADIEPGMHVLEPSAGSGNIVRGVFDAAPVHITAVEADEARLVELHDNFFSWANTRLRTIHADFLSLTPEPIYDRVVMNPPFSKRQDIQHVRHAVKFLKPHGKLVAVMAAGITFRTDRQSLEFQSLIGDYDGGIEKLPERSFEESGTSVNAVIVEMVNGKESRVATPPAAQEIPGAALGSRPRDYRKAEERL